MKTRELILIFLFLDLLLLNGSVLIFSCLYFEWDLSVVRAMGNLILLLSGSWIVTYLIFLDNLHYVKSGFWDMLKIQIQKFVIFIAIVSVCEIIFKINAFQTIVLFGPQALFFIFKFALSIYLLYYYALRNRQNWSPTIIIGDNNTGNEMYRYLEKNPYLGFNPLGILDDTFDISSQRHVIGTIDDFQAIYDDYPFNNVIIALPLSEKEHIKELILIAERNGIRPRIVPHYYDEIDRAFNVQTLGDIPLLNIRSVPLDKYPNRFWKRALDLVFGTCGLLLLSPLLVLIAFAIKIDSKGPVLYKPTRLGVDNEPFVLYKFRSMKYSNGAHQAQRSTVLNDPRVTRLGRILRKYNLDELPQLFNVLNNEMSIVGPRPHRVHLNKKLQQKMNTYMIRHYVKPGITGWAQVNGWRGPTETKMQYMGRTLHDLWYIENWNFGLDLYIILLTVYSKKSRLNAF